MEMLGISESEQRAIWRVLAAIYHLGAAGACKGTSFLPSSPGLPAIPTGGHLTRPFSRWGGTASVYHHLCVRGCRVGGCRTRHSESETGLGLLGKPSRASLSGRTSRREGGGLGLCCPVQKPLPARAY